MRNAVDLHHLPEGTRSLAPRPGSLVRLIFQIGPRGRSRTRNLPVLSGTPLLVGLHAEESWHSRQESRLQPPRSKRGALYIELRERAEEWSQQMVMLHPYLAYDAWLLA
jgi:hypothetical protein